MRQPRIRQRLARALATFAVMALAATLVTGVARADTGLAAPANLRATPDHHGAIVLAWQAVPGATSYVVYRGTTSHGESATPYFSGDVSTTFHNTLVVAATVYYYQVAAANKNGVGPRSNEAASSTTQSVTLVTPTPTTTPAISPSGGGSSNKLWVIVLIVLAMTAGIAGMWLWRRGNLAHAPADATGGAQATTPRMPSPPPELFPRSVFDDDDTAQSTTPLTTTSGAMRLPPHDAPLWPTSAGPGNWRRQVAASDTLSTGAVVGFVLIGLGLVGVFVVTFLLISGALNGGQQSGIASVVTATPRATATSAPSPGPTVTPTLSTGQDVIAINAGGAAAGAYVADTDVTGGSTNSTGDAIDTSQVSNPAPQTVYQSERWGVFTYAIPNLAPGATYTVRLHFAEIFFKHRGERRFNVAINGLQVLTNFDIVQAAGGPDIAIVKTFNAQADQTGTITISFTTGAANFAKVCGIEIVQGS